MTTCRTWPTRSKKGGGRRGCPPSILWPCPSSATPSGCRSTTGATCTLSSGPFYTMHADFWNAWNQRVLRPPGGQVPPCRDRMPVLRGVTGNDPLLT